MGSKEKMGGQVSGRSTVEEKGKEVRKESCFSRKKFREGTRRDFGKASFRVGRPPLYRERVKEHLSPIFDKCKADASP